MRIPSVRILDDLMTGMRFNGGHALGFSGPSRLILTREIHAYETANLAVDSQPGRGAADRGSVVRRRGRHLRIELDDGSVLLVAASWEGVHVLVDPGVPATRKGRPTKEPPSLCWQVENMPGVGFEPTWVNTPGILSPRLPRAQQSTI